MQTNTKKQILNRVLMLAKRRYFQEQERKEQEDFEKHNPFPDGE